MSSLRAGRGRGGAGRSAERDGVRRLGSWLAVGVPIPTARRTTCRRRGLLLCADYRWPGFARFADDVPLVLIDDGRILEEHLQRTKVSEDDILEQARMLPGWRGWARSNTPA